MTDPHREPIRLTWVAVGSRAATDEFHTDSLKEALHAFIDKSFASDASPDKMVLSIIIERRDRYTPEEAAKEYAELAALERVRIERAA